MQAVSSCRNRLITTSIHLLLSFVPYSRHDCIIYVNFLLSAKEEGSELKGVMLGTPAVATIMILDDDHCGIFHFEGNYSRNTLAIFKQIDIAQMHITASIGSKAKN